MKKTALIMAVVLAAFAFIACNNTTNQSGDDSKPTTQAMITDIPVDALATALNGGSFIEPIKTAEPTPTPEPEEEAVEFQSPELLKAICDEYGFENGYVTESDLEMVTAIHFVAQRTMYGSKNISSLQDLELLPNLTELSIEQIPSNNTEDFLKGINKCKSLTSVRLKGCKLDSLERLTVLDNLEELAIIDCIGISDYSILGKLVGVKKLSISDSHLTRHGNTGFVSQLTDLEELRIRSQTSNSYEDGLELDFSKLKKIRKLSIVGFYDCKKVIKDLYDNGAYYNITDMTADVLMSKRTEDFDVLCKFAGLKNLYLNVYSYAGDADYNLNGIEKLINLRKLSVRFNRFDSITDLNAISGLRNLEALALNYVPKRDFSFLNELTKLKHIVFDGIDRDVALREFQTLEKLESIALRAVIQSKSLDLDGIQSLPSLREIYYYSYSFTPTNLMLLDDRDGFELINCATDGDKDAFIMLEEHKFEFMD